MTQEVSRKRPDTSLSAIAKSFSVKPGTPLSPFICSTVDDFQNEHSILHENVFPELSELCFLRRTHFSPIDLGWDPGSKKSKEEDSSFEVLRLNLDYVTKCAPFFLCLLGERYGSFRDPAQPHLSCSSLHWDVEETEEENQSWLDKNLLFAASSGYKWLLDDIHQYLSITELTIRHAVFSASYSSAAAAQHFSFFYLRQPDHLELLESDLEHLSPDKRSAELALYKSELESAAVCIEQLKLSIIKKGLSVRYFSTAKQLATFALNDWKSVIDFLYPPLDSRVTGSEWYSEKIEQNIFSAKCRQLLVHTNTLDSIMKKLTDFVLNRIVKLKSSDINSAKTTLARTDVVCSRKTALETTEGQGRDESLLLLVGSRGCGKSSLLATWLDSFCRASPPVKIFEHYVGCTETSTSAVAMMKRCIARLRSAKDYIPGIDYGFNVEDLEEYHRIREEFHAVIDSERCVLVLDNIDGLFRSGDASDQMIKDVKWLPFPLPPTVTVIASCTKTDVAYHLLVDRPDVRVIYFPVVDDMRTRRAMLLKNTELNGRVLDRGDLDLVLDGCLADRPLYLALLGAEMRVFVASERTLGCIRRCSEALSICDLWGHIVRRWMSEYSWKDGKSDKEYSDWVADTLRLILTSRRGLLQSELMEILSELGFTGFRSISSVDWLRFQLAASSVLVRSSAGLMHFMHDHIRAATDFVLFGCVTPLNGYRKLGKTPFKDVGLETQECHLPSKIIYHRYIANYFVKQPFGERQADELPWQLNKLQDYEMLAKLISDDHRIFMAMYGKGCKSHRAWEILGYWKTLLKAGFNPGTIYNDALGRIYSEHTAVKHASLQDPKIKSSCFTQQYGKLSICIGQLLMQLGCRAEAREALKHGIHHLKKIMPLSKAELILLSRLQALSGSVVVDCEGGRLEAINWFDQALATIESLLNNVLWDKQRKNLIGAKGCLLVHLGNVKTEDSDFAEAEALLDSARHCMVQAKNSVGIALVLCSIGQLQILQKEFNRSEESLWSALITLESYHGKSHPNVARIYSHLGTLAAHTENSEGFNISKAEELYRTAIKLNEECFGSCHVLVANDLLSLGILLWCNGKNSQKEEGHEMTKRAFDICTLQLGDDHPLTRKVHGALASQEIQIALQLQTLQETTTHTQRQNLLPNRRKSKVHCKRQTSLCRASVKPSQLLPVVASLSTDTHSQQLSNVEIHEAFDTESSTTLPKRVVFVPRIIPGSRCSRDNNSVSVGFPQDLDEQRRCTTEKLKRLSIQTHHGSAPTYRTNPEAIPGHTSPEDGTHFEETASQKTNSTQERTSTGMRRHLSCFEYDERVPRSIMSGPYAAIDSLLNKQQFSLPRPGSLH